MTTVLLNQPTMKEVVAEAKIRYKGLNLYTQIEEYTKLYTVVFRTLSANNHAKEDIEKAKSKLILSQLLFNGINHYNKIGRN
jgi:predicted restriction endonuclease